MSELDEVDEDSDEEVETATAAEVLQRLEEAWLNEKLAPELLEAKSELIECMADQIKEMEENIQRAKKGDIRISIHRMEIEKFTTSILEKEKQRSEEENSHLTPEEFTFAQEYEDSQEGHFRNLVLRHMPPNLQGMDPKQTAVTPNLDQYVFLRVNEDTDGVLVEEETLDQGEEIVDLQKGDQHIMRYKPISALVTSSAVTLI